MKFVRWLFALAGVFTLGWVVLKRLAGQGEPLAEPRPPEWPPLATPPAATPGPPVDTEGAATPGGWVTPDADGQCPIDYPVKAKDASGIYHVEDGLSYARTRADRCYSSAGAAEADGYRPAKN